MKLKTSAHINFNLRIILVSAFCLILLAQAYIAYAYLYNNIFGEEIEAPPGNVVRVNLKSYESTVEYLEGLYEYSPDSVQLPRSNPFQ